MSVPTTTVSIELNQIEAGEFVVGSSLVGGSDVIGDGLSDVNSNVTRCSIRRGRWGALTEDFEAANVSVVLNNESRLFDPVYAAGAYFGELVPSRVMEIKANGITIATSFIEDYDLEYDVSSRSVTVLKATDALGRFGALQFDEWTNTATDAASKLNAICDRDEIGWSSALRDFIGAEYDFGGDVNEPLTLQSDAVSWNSNALNYAQLIARSDLLSFFFATAGGSLTLRPVFAWALTANSWTPGAAVAAFGTGGLPINTISAQYGTETLFSEVSVDYEGGTAQTAFVADRAAWQLTYGPQRRLSLGGLLLDEQNLMSGGITYVRLAADVAMDLAESLLAHYDAPTFRITEFSVQLAALVEADQDTVLAIDIAQPIDISFTPNGVGAAIEQTLIVQGIGHDITPDSHVVTFSVIDYLT